IQMADVNVNAPAEQAPAMALPTHTDDQILPRSRCVTIGKRNCYLDVERSQINPIYNIAVDILKKTNFFRAFIASSTIPSIYIQQFWDTVRYDKTTRNYSCQLDEQWFDLTKDTLRDALQITPVDNNNAFTSPPTPDALIKFVNDLGYPKVVRTLSDVVTNDMFQPWRALTTIINLCLTGKTSGFERPRAPCCKFFGASSIEPISIFADRTKAHLIVIPSVRFYQAEIVYYLQKLAQVQPETGFLHLPNEEHLIDEVVDEGVPDKEPLYGDEEADTQRAIEESLKEVHGAHRGPLPPVVFREPDSGKFQPLPEVQDRYIFQRCTSTQTEPSGHDESSSLYAELGLTDSETESDEEVLPVIQSGAQDEGQAGPKPVVVHAGPNLKHMDFEVTDTLIQQNPEQIDEEFTTTAYLNVQVNLKLPTEDQVRLEEPASSARTLSSLQHLDKELSFADQFLSLNQSPQQFKHHYQHQQQLSQQSQQQHLFYQYHLNHNKAPQIRFLSSASGDLNKLMAEANKPGGKDYDKNKGIGMSQDVVRSLEKSYASVHTEPVLTDLADARRKKKKRHALPKTLPGSPPHQPPPPPPPPGSSGTPGASGAFGSSQLPHPPPPPSTNQSDQSKSTAAPSSSKDSGFC
ncbi:hypothetical protein Tco_0883847, partial [Tanacetum coccineum]